MSRAQTFSDVPFMLWVRSFLFKPAQVAHSLRRLCAQNVSQHSHKLFFYFLSQRAFFLRNKKRKKKKNKKEEVYLSHHFFFINSLFQHGNEYRVRCPREICSPTGSFTAAEYSEAPNFLSLVGASHVWGTSGQLTGWSTRSLFDSRMSRDADISNSWNCCIFSALLQNIFFFLKFCYTHSKVTGHIGHFTAAPLSLYSTEEGKKNWIQLVESKVCFSGFWIIFYI